MYSQIFVCKAGESCEELRAVICSNKSIFFESLLVINKGVLNAIHIVDPGVFIASSELAP